MLLAGLDIETTGTDMKAGHRLIQIGIYIKDTETGNVFSCGSDVRPIGKMVISPDALRVNGFTKKRINKAPSQDSVDAMLWREMLKAGYKHDTLIPVGYNVIMFDMLFIKKELPLISLLFTYPSEQRSTRAIDLTSLGLLYTHKTGTPYDIIKKDCKAYVAGIIGHDNEHDALYDAQAAIVALDFYRDKFGDHT